MSKRLSEEQFVRRKLTEFVKGVAQSRGVTELAILLKMAESISDPDGAELTRRLAGQLGMSKVTQAKFGRLVPEVAAKLAEELRDG